MDTKGIKRNFVVCFDHSQGDKPVLIVGENKNGVLSIISAFENENAVNLYAELSKGETRND